VTETVTIDRRFRGPPESGQGGYSCGVVAARLGPAAEVSLRLPPPLDRPLALVEVDGGLELHDGEAMVAAGRPFELDLDVSDPPAADEARAASDRCPWVERHPFPMCFACGPDRHPPDGLRIIMGPLEAPCRFAATWTPDPSLADADGAVVPELVWAALDCPTAAPAVPVDAPASVLARMRALLDAPVRAGEPHVVTSWLVGHDGRKHVGACAIHGPDGELRACSEGLWVELRDPRTHGART
jgi:hypothetical protein